MEEDVMEEEERKKNSFVFVCLSEESWEQFFERKYL